MENIVHTWTVDISFVTEAANPEEASQEIERMLNAAGIEYVNDPIVYDDCGERIR